MKNHENEARSHWGNTDAYREHEQKTKNYTKEKWAQANDGMMIIFAEFFACEGSGASADSAEAQTLSLPDMYGKNLTFKTGGVDGCDCEETLKLIAEGKLDTDPLITHTYPLSKIDEAYKLFENKRDGVIKVAVEC